MSNRRLRIAWGVMGYGRGHATRVRSVLPGILDHHDVTVFAGGDAFPVLAPLVPTVRIPTRGYAYGPGGDVSVVGTVARNTTGMSDLLFGGHGLDSTVRELRARGIDLVISDSEAWTHRAAQRLRLPRISFDHIGVIAWCKPHFPAGLWLRGQRDAWLYRRLMGRPDRALVTSFYPAEPMAGKMRVIGPVLRQELCAAEATVGDYLLAYFNRGRYQYTAALDLALRRLDIPVVVYGTPYRGRSDNLEFRAPGNAGFIRDLAGCRAVLGTAGNQLIGEAVHFRKPVLALPENVFEQQLNAHMVVQMGIGQRARLTTLTVGDVEDFLVGVEACRARMPERPANGRSEAIRLLLQYLEELRPCEGRVVSRKRHKPLTHFAPS